MIFLSSHDASHIARLHVQYALIEDRARLAVSPALTLVCFPKISGCSFKRRGRENLRAVMSYLRPT